MADDIQRQLEKMQRQFALAERDLFGYRASSVADGIRESGLARDIATLGDEIGHRIEAGAALVAGGLWQLSSELGAQTRALQSIQQTLDNPLSVAAAERLRRGRHALQQGWYAEAVEELSASVEQDRFNPLSHFDLGRARLALGDVAAAEDFNACRKYATGDLPELKSAAAILASAALERAGRTEESATVLLAGISEVPNCPELYLRLGAITGQASYVRAAIMMEPALGIPAVAERLPGAADACIEITDTTQSQYANLCLVMSGVHSMAGVTGWQVWPEIFMQQLPDPSDGVTARLVFLSRTLSELRRTQLRMDHVVQAAIESIAGRLVSCSAYDLVDRQPGFWRVVADRDDSLDLLRAEIKVTRIKSTRPEWEVFEGGARAAKRAQDLERALDDQVDRVIAILTDGALRSGRTILDHYRYLNLKPTVSPFSDGREQRRALV